MRCDKIQELVLTDYLDGELKGELLRSVEIHLTDCGKCREFAHHARKATVEPFEQLERLEPSARLWEKIQESIVAETQQTATAVHVGLWDWLGRLFPVPRPVFALAAITVVFSITLTLLIGQPRHNSVVQSETRDQIEYIAALVEVTTASDQDANGGYGTVIEEYFL